MGAFGRVDTRAMLALKHSLTNCADLSREAVRIRNMGSMYIWLLKWEALTNQPLISGIMKSGNFAKTDDRSLNFFITLKTFL